jgi:ribosomal protein S18 acetylase RimI-like enzyme
MSVQAEMIEIKNAPPIPGLIFRGFRGEADYPLMAEIINAANKADGEDDVAKVEDIALNYAHIQRSDPDTDMLFIEINGEPMGYGRCMWDAEAEGDYLYSFFLHMKPEGRGRGISLPVLEYFLDRLTQVAAGHPADSPKYFQTWSLESKTWNNRLLEQLGMAPVRYGFGMKRLCSKSIEPLPLPEGIETRPVKEEHMRAIFDAESEAFRDHWGYVKPTEKDFERFLADPYHDPSLWKVAWDGDEVVGMVRNFINKDENENANRKRGYTEDISVRRPWRRRGIARALLIESILMFQQIGMEETYLGVDTENPSGALNLYKGVGYEKDRTWLTYRKPLDN